MSEEKQVKYDLDGYSAVTEALRDLLNQYPGLADGDEIVFATLGEEYGKAFYPLSEAIIESERRDILGGVQQTCKYPFIVIYKVGSLSESRKAGVKEWLDTLGRWLEQQPIEVDGVTYRIDEYPPLARGGYFLTIGRQTPAYLDSTENNNVENWAMRITARYINEF